MGQITLNKPSGGQLTLSPEDGTSNETVVIPSVGVGKVLHVATKVVHTPVVFSLNSYIQIAPLDIPFTKVGTNSKIIITWMMNAEAYQDVGFRVYKDGSLASNGRSTVSGEKWSTFITAAYDQDESSTPSNFIIQYIDESPSSGTYQIFAGSTAGGTAQPFALNRTWNSTGSIAFEQMVSTITLMEVAS